MLNSYPLVVSLMIGAGPFPCGHVCACSVPLGDVSSPEVMARFARRGAVAIFLGTVIAVDTIVRDSVDYSDGTSPVRRRLVYPTVIRYTLAVERTWKGPVATKVAVTDYAVGDECGRAYEKGEAYLVYAHKDQRTGGRTSFTTTFCSRVLLKSDAAADRRLLGDGRAPGG